MIAVESLDRLLGVLSGEPSATSWSPDAHESRRLNLSQEIGWFGPSPGVTVTQILLSTSMRLSPQIKSFKHVLRIALIAGSPRP